MLCCGLLTLIAATGIGTWRWLRTGPRTLWTIGVVTLVAVPAISWAATASTHRLSRADIVARALHSLCGTS